MSTPSARQQRDWVLLNSDPEPTETFLAILLSCLALAILTTPSASIQSAIGIIRDVAGDDGVYGVSVLLFLAAVAQLVSLRCRWIGARIAIAGFEMVVFSWMAGTNLLSQAWLGLGPLTLFLAAYTLKSLWVVWRLNRPGVR